MTRKPELLPLALRVWTQRAAPSEEENPADEISEFDQPTVPLRRYPNEALIFDTETEPEPAQRLRLLVWRFYRDRPGAEPAQMLVEEGIAYADDLPRRDPHGYAALERYVNDPAHSSDAAGGMGDRLKFEPLSWWLEQRFYRYGYRHRDRCAVVGFNLLFDLGRLASYWAPASGDYRGGFSLGIWGDFDAIDKWEDRRYHPRLRLKAIDPRRTLISWGSLKRDDADDKGRRSRFVDLRTLAFALTDRSYDLEHACQAFGDPWEKPPVDLTVLDERLIGYAREDVEHTALLYRNCLAELRLHERTGLEPERLYSPASIGSRYLEAMGVRRPLEKFTSLTREQLGWKSWGQNAPSKRRSPQDPLDPRVLGWSMSAFYGGRAEARIVRTPVPVVVCDFTSMYPTVNALLETWSILRAQTLTTRDVTASVAALVDDPRLPERCLTRDLWSEIGVTLVELEPHGAILPARAKYDPSADAGYGIGLNPLHYKGTLWYTLPDVVAACLLQPEHTLRVIRALRLTANGTQRDLHTVPLRGGKPIDPARMDPFLAMVEERHLVNTDRSRPEEERNRLERFLKITANATAYGVLARFDRREYANPTPLTIFGADEEPFDWRSPHPEDPGPYCFPPIAAAITAGARLLLAILEHEVTEAGGAYAFCDTDSLAIVATPDGGRVHCTTAQGKDIDALSWPQVRAILARFDQLNPYDRTLIPSLWKPEHDSLEQETWCYAISAKRYCLYRPRRARKDVLEVVDRPDADPDDGFEDWSEHGLGLYADPTSESADQPRRDDKGRRLWVRDAWEWILNDALGTPAHKPDSSDRYALTRFTVSSPQIAEWFTGFDETQPRDLRMRPGSFGLLAHPDTHYKRFTGDARPASPYESKPEHWPDLPWYDRNTGQPLEVFTTSAVGWDPDALTSHLERGAVPLQTLADILRSYRRKIEYKSLAPDGQPSTETTPGQLQRCPIAGLPEETELTGKESNFLSERLTGQLTDPADYQASYGYRAVRWSREIVPILREIGAQQLIRETGFSAGSVHAILRDRPTIPRPRRRTQYEDIAIRHATERLVEWLEAPSRSKRSIPGQYLNERRRRFEQRRCEFCGRPLDDRTRADARFCSDRCRQAAHRRKLRCTVSSNPDP